MSEKTYFCFSDNIVNIVTMNTRTSYENLPAGVYTLMFNDMTGFYLKFDKDSFDVPNKIFGNVNKRAKHVITRYNSSDKSLGVLLTGNKGSGKSLFTTVIANTFIKDKNLPVIMINEKYTGPNLNDFINTIGECVIMFDEFGKVYGHQEQNKLLTLFDGLMSTKRMILVTENETRMLNEFILNRPGRFMYHFKYSKLEEDAVNEYCEYMNIPDKIVNEIHSIRKTTSEFSMDTLTAIVNEYLLFGADVEFSELMSYLNISSNNETTMKLILDKVLNSDGEQLTSNKAQSFNISSLRDFGICVDISNTTIDNNAVECDNNESILHDDNDDTDSEVYLNERHIKIHEKDKLVMHRDDYTFVFTIQDMFANDMNKFLALL